MFPITVTRSGGVAGIHEKAVIASDGGVDLTTKDGRRQCTLDPMVLTALRHAAKAITGRASASAAHPDDLVVIVTTGRGSARVEDPALTAVPARCHACSTRSRPTQCVADGASVVAA